MNVVHTWYVSSLIRLSYLRMPFTESLLLLCSMSTSFSSSLTLKRVKGQRWLLQILKGQMVQTAVIDGNDERVMEL